MKQKVDQFIDNMVAEAFSELDISRVHVLESYVNTIKYKDLFYNKRAKEIQGYINGWYVMMNAYNKGAGITPSRSIKDYKNGDSC